MTTSISQYRSWKTETIEALGGRCVECGATERLEFDHRDPSTKLFSLGKRWGMADKEKLAIEALK